MTIEPYKPTKPRVLTMFPPNIGRITRVFPHARKPGVVFTYGDTIYAPHLNTRKGQELPPELIAHEMVHIEQQHGMSPEVWWAMYLADPMFRFGMEVPAHKAELDYLRVNRKPFMHVPARLLSPLYGFAQTLGSTTTVEEMLILLDDYSYGTMAVIDEAPKECASP